MITQRPFATRSLPLAVLTLFLVLITHHSLLITAEAQSATATLSGTVEDANGAVVPGTSITITNVATTLKRETTTNDEGNFTVPLLPPGTYTLRAEHDGFAIVQVENITLNVGDQKALQIQLKTGDVKAEVQVVSDAPLINESPAVATIVDRTFVENIPLNGRSFQSLIALTPGVVMVPGSNTSGQFSINGQRANANVFLVDGVSANFAANPTALNGAQTSGNLPGLTALGTTQSLASVDAMQEFQVQTSGYSAEYGRQPGGQISIVTRSGTNSFHGSVFEYFRNDVFDANDWFANANRQPRPPMRQNDFGGTLGGPIFLPGLGDGGPYWYNGRNRSFFFFSYEGLQLRLPQFSLINVPTQALRQNAPPGLDLLLKAFPLPNGRELTFPTGPNAGQPSGLAEFSASYSNASSFNATSVRIDHAVNSKWHLFGRYNFVPSESAPRAADTLSTVSPVKVATRSLTLGSTVTAFRRGTNELRFNYTGHEGIRTFYFDEHFAGAIPVSLDAVLPSQYVSSSSSLSLVLLLPGRTALFPQISLIKGNFEKQKQINIVDGFTYISGAHQLKFGVDYRRLTPFRATNLYRANFTYTSQAGIINNLPPILGISSSLAQYPIFTNFSAYGQDTWKATSRLTLDLGLRWDVNPAPDEANGNLPLAVTQISNLATMELASQRTPLWKTTYGNFGPRFGFAYQVRQHAGSDSVVRGGFGVYFDTGNNQASSGYNGYPFSVSRSAPGVTFPLTATQVAPPSLPNTSSLTPPYSSITIFDPKLQLPYTLQWSLALQQSLGNNQALTVSYVGAQGRRLLQQRRLDLRTVNPRFTFVSLTTNNATSDYHAFQAQFQRRLSRGVQALVSYTWSHAIDEDSIDTGTVIPVRGNAAFDLRRNLSGVITYDLPRPSGATFLRAALGHWSIDTLFYAQTGLPVDISSSEISIPPDGSFASVRPNVIAGVPLYVEDSRVPGGRRINSAAFSGPAAGQFGNLGRNVVRGLGAWQVDLALRRQFGITERLKLQFRAEAFNLFNHPNFGAIQTFLTAPNFGQAINMRNRQLATGLNQLYQIGGPRSLQFALKATF